MRKLFSIILFLTTFCTGLSAQELEAKVSINHAQVGNTTRTDVFEELQNKITSFLNEHTWTSMHFKESERIKCNLSITVNTYSETDNSFTCSMVLTVSRPVYNSTYTTTTYSTKDKDFNFNFQLTDQLEYQGADRLENNLVALLSYYAYMIIGYDMDSFAPLGGTQMFQSAEDIVTNADNLGYTGWKAFDDRQNRFALVNDYMDGSMEPFRQLVYKYHRQGLDRMAENTDSARAAITECIDLLDEAHQGKVMCQLPQLFTEYKRDELINIYKKKGKSDEIERVINVLSAIDPSQNNKWETMKER